MLVVIMLALNLLDNAEHWQFDRAAILTQSQWWRLFTGHWVHANTEHTLLNLMSFLGALFLLPVLRQPARLMALIVFSSLGISIALLCFNPNMEYYLGFSGVFYALLAGGSIVAWRQATACIIAAFLIVKITIEQTIGPMTYSTTMTGGNVATAAHLYGVVAGITVSATMMAVIKTKQHPIAD